MCVLSIGAPKLDHLDPKEIEKYISHSVPITTKARENHNNEIRLLNQPWWRKLGDEFQDSMYEDDIIL